MAKISLNGIDWVCKDYLDEDWIWRSGEKAETRDVRWWKPARVPGSVTDDLWRCGEIVDPYFEKNSLCLEWIPQRTWIYRKEFTLKEDVEGKQVHLCFEGVDYEALFYLNDVYLGTHCSMYTPVEFDVTKVLKKEGKNLLSVVIKKAPNEESQVSKTRYVKTHKSRMTYSQVRKLDSSRYFLESSPTGRMFNNTLENIAKDPAGLHDVHGPWEHQGLTEQYTLYNAGTSLLSSEFGVEGMTNYDTLAKGMEESHMWPPSRDNDLYFHRGSWWNNYPLLQKCFGEKLTEIRQTVRASQFMQYEGLKYAVESNRRRALSCSGTFP